MSTEAKVLKVCADTCILINLAIVSRLDLLARLPGITFYVPQEVLAEITVLEQRQQAEAEIASGRLKLARIENAEELQRFVEYTGRFGRGESACLAIAVCRKWAIATDETKDRRLSQEITGRALVVINTPGVLLKAIMEKVLSIEDADAIKGELEKRRFRMKFRSFRDLAT